MLVKRNRNPLMTGFDLPSRLLDTAFNDLMPEWPGEQIVGSYPVDIREDDGHLFVEAELPGFKKGDVEVTLENGVLTIAAQRKEETESQGTRHLNERRITRVQRAFKIPTAVDENKVEASLKDGVLHLTLHKREEVKPRRIEVK